MVKLNKKKKHQKKIKRYVDDLEQDKGAQRLAVAVKYDVEKDKAPRIIATGKGNVAQKILELAEEHQVPFYEDESLTDILSKLDLEQEIPGELYVLVAEVLSFIYQLDKLAKKKEMVKKKRKKKA